MDIKPRYVADVLLKIFRHCTYCIKGLVRNCIKAIPLFLYALVFFPAALSYAEEMLQTFPYITAQTIREKSELKNLKLRSHAALVYDERDNEVIVARNADQVMPVASLSKLIMAMVVIDAEQDMDEEITISKTDRDRIRYSRSRLRTGMRFARKELLQIALVASENRAAMALARTYPGGNKAFVMAMNTKAKELGLKKTRFADPAGLLNENVSTAEEMMQIALAAGKYDLISEYTTQKKQYITERKRKRKIEFGNTNRLVRRKAWPITLSKTGYTSEAGNCLLMKTSINDRPVVIVLLESWGKLSKYGDSNRIRKWLLKSERLAGKQALLAR